MLAMQDYFSSPSNRMEAASSNRVSSGLERRHDAEEEDVEGRTVQRHGEEDDEDEEEEMEVKIRQVVEADLGHIAKLFQKFDNDKYSHIRTSSGDQKQRNNNNNNKEKNNSSSTAAAAAASGPSSPPEVSMAGMRIDRNGGIYLCPLLDVNNAYFKCYVAQDMNTGHLIGYILFFHTLHEHATGAGQDDPVAVIEDLFVLPKFRGRGIGTQLFRRVLKCSLERGCISCECLLIPDSVEGLRFWRRKVGGRRVQAAVEAQPRTHSALGEQNHHHPHQRKSATNEAIVELKRPEMKNIYDETRLTLHGREEFDED